MGGPSPKSVETLNGAHGSSSYAHRKPRRHMLSTESNCRYVDRDEFCRLLLGFSQMDRVDDPESGLRGLRDTATGMLYVIEHDKLTSLRPRMAT